MLISAAWYYAKEEFGLGDQYEVRFPKARSQWRCDGWRWTPTDDLTVEVTPNFEGGQFSIVLIDQAVVRAEAAAAEDARRRSIVRPKL